MKNMLKKFCLAMVCLSILFMSIPQRVNAAGEPGNGYYRIKNVGTGKYVCYNGISVYFSSHMTDYTTWVVENTTGSNKWFAIRPSADKNLALSFSDKDAKVSLETYIPGNVDRYESNYNSFTKQRFTFGWIPSGYNIKPIAFSNNVDNRVLDSVDNYFTLDLQLKKASGARTQIFVLEYIDPL